MKKEFYNIEDGNKIIHKILVYSSTQFVPGERYLTVGAKSKAWKLPTPCHAVDPTPYYPRIIFTR